MIEFLIDKMHDARFMTMLFAAIAASATAYTLIMPLFAGDGLNKRMKAVASERERIRQRERDRLTRSREGLAAADAEADRLQGRRGLQSHQVAGPGSRARQAGHGRLSRPGALRHVPVLPPGDADRAASSARCSMCSSSRTWSKSMPVKIGICVGAAYLGMQAPMLFLKNAISEAPAVDQARVSRCARSAADLHRIRHVDRSRVPQGQRRDRLAIDPARGGIHADHGGTVLSAGSQGGLRKPGQAHRPRRREVGLSGACSSRSATARRSARPCA